MSVKEKEQSKLTNHQEIPQKEKESELNTYYFLLDGIKGVTSILSLLYHITNVNKYLIKDLNESKNKNVHFSLILLPYGYLLSEFFIFISGFLIGHSYDNKLKLKTLSICGFIKRRILRILPLIIFGAIESALFYCFGIIKPMKKELFA